VLGQNCLGRIGRFALGGGIGGGLLACRIELDEFLGRFLGRLVRGRGGGHLVLGVRQGSVGQFLLRRRIGQRFCGGVGLGLRLLLALLRLSQGSPGIRRRFALGGGLCCRLILLLGRFRRGLGGLLSGLGSRGGRGHLVL